MTRSIPLLGLVVLACSHGPAAPAVPPSPSPAGAETGPASLDPDDVDRCAECHAEIVAEWRESMHARAHHDADPIYAGVRRIRMKREGAQIAAACAGCHTPRSAAAPEAPEARVGVACGACHAVRAVVPGARGAAALTPSAPGLLLGPSDLSPGASDAHATGPAPVHMKDRRGLCLACHGELKGPSGVPICTTGPEHEQVGAMGSRRRSCVSCHMAREGGDASHANHRFMGPHRAWYQDDPAVLADSVELTVTLAGSTASVRLVNRTGHAFPTGFPGRVAVVQVVGHDASGAEVWRSWTDDPAREHPVALLDKVYQDAEGKRTLAPYAARLARDNRLKPGEVRALTLQVPPQVTRVEARLIFRLLGPGLAKKLLLTGAPEAAPRVVATATATATEAAPAPAP